MNRHKAIVRRCDPGIRSTVRLLLKKGYPCTDSGDGVTKLAAGWDPEWVSDFPHVWMVYTSKAMRDRDLLRLQRLLDAHPELPVRKAEAFGDYEPAKDDVEAPVIGHGVELARPLWILGAV